MADERVAVPGSERKPEAGARVVGVPDLYEFIEVTVLLRRPKPLPAVGAAAPLTREEFAAEYSASTADVELVEAFAHEHDLTVVHVDRLPGPRAVEVHDVQRLGPLRHPVVGGEHRVVGVHGRLLEAALDEAHRPALEDVDGGVEDHARTREQTAAKLRSSASPWAEDFSGWNWTPKSGSRSTALTKVSPYSLVPSTSDASDGRGAKLCTW